MTLDDKERRDNDRKKKEVVGTETETQLGGYILANCSMNLSVSFSLGCHLNLEN